MLKWEMYINIKPKTTDKRYWFKDIYSWIQVLPKHFVSLLSKLHHAGITYFIIILILLFNWMNKITYCQHKCGWSAWSLAGRSNHVLRSKCKRLVPLTFWSMCKYRKKYANRLILLFKGLKTVHTIHGKHINVSKRCIVGETLLSELKRYQIPPFFH